MAEVNLSIVVKRTVDDTCPLYLGYLYRDQPANTQMLNFPVHATSVKVATMQALDVAASLFQNFNVSVRVDETGESSALAAPEQ